MLLLALPVVLLAELQHWLPVVIFLVSCVGLIPLAGLIGESTEQLAEITGSQIGGLLNATLGNAAELIITIVAIREGLLALVKASITGSIIGNLLLVFGLSLLLGGLKNGEQKFNRERAGQHANMLLLCVIALAIPSLFASGITEFAPTKYLSLGVAGVMITLYVLSIVHAFTAKGEGSPIVRESAAHGPASEHWPVWLSVVMLGIATVGVVWLSEVLVGAVEPIVAEYTFITEFFLGIIIIPIVGNVAEHIVAVQVALKNDMDLSLEIAISSSLQIALFVAPVLVFVSLLMGNPLTLVFVIYELLALAVATAITVLIALDGRSNWLEGAQLLGVYVVLAVGYFFLS